MEPRDAVEPRGIDVGELGRRAAIGEHRALALGVDEQHDRAGAARPLHAHVDARRGEVVGEAPRPRHPRRPGR